MSEHDPAMYLQLSAKLYATFTVTVFGLGFPWVPLARVTSPESGPPAAQTPVNPPLLLVVDTAVHDAVIADGGTDVQLPNVPADTASDQVWLLSPPCCIQEIVAVAPGDGLPVGSVALIVMTGGEICSPLNDVAKNPKTTRGKIGPGAVFKVTDRA